MSFQTLRGILPGLSCYKNNLLYMKELMMRGQVAFRSRTRRVTRLRQGDLQWQGPKLAGRLAVPFPGKDEPGRATSKWGRLS